MDHTEFGFLTGHSNDLNMKKRQRVSESSGSADFASVAHETSLASLNASFASYVSSTKADPSQLWIDASVDYLVYAQDLDDRFAKGFFESRGSRVLAFGTGDFGQLGNGVDRAESSRPLMVDGDLADVDVLTAEAGGMHNALVDASGTLWTWGCGDDDVLGRAGDENYPLRVDFGLLNVRILRISCGDCHTCAVGASGRVFAFGTYKDKDGKNWFRNSKSGDAFGQTQASPFLLEEVNNVVDVKSGNNHSVALTASGNVFSWGFGEQGQLGRANVSKVKDDNETYLKDQVRDTHLTPSPMDVKGAAGGVQDAVRIGCGAYHTFVLRRRSPSAPEGASTFRVFGCGLNQYRQLDGAAESVVFLLRPLRALDELRLVSVDGGEHFSAGISVDGDLYTWGRCDQSQLGLNLETLEYEGENAGKLTKPGAFVDSPFRVNLSGEKAASVGCGGSHSLVTTSVGSLFSFGFGEVMQLGNGKEKDEEVPKRVDVFLRRTEKVSGTVIRASGGGQHSLCVLRE